MDESAKLAKETRTVRLTELAWTTSLLAKIACRFEEPGALCGVAAYVALTEKTPGSIGRPTLSTPHKWVVTDFARSLTIAAANANRVGISWFWAARIS